MKKYLLALALLFSLPAAADFIGNPVPPNAGGTGTQTAPTAGQLLVGNSGGTAYVPLTIGGDIIFNSSGVTTIQASAVAHIPVFTTSAPGLVPTSPGGTLGFLRADGTWQIPPGGGGGVSSVGFSDASSTPIFSIGNSPITGSGTLTETLVTQSANTALMGPTSGSAAEPAFRTLVGADIPAISLAASGAGGVSGNLGISHLNSGTAASSTTFWRGDGVWAVPAGGGGGGATSVGLADGSTIPIFNISNSPVTSTGTLTETLAVQSAHDFLAGPSSGSAVQPTFRAIVASDIPTLNQSTTGNAATATALAAAGTDCSTGNFATGIDVSGNAICVAGNAPFQQFPTGLINGSNTTYTLATAPSSASAFILFLNGQILAPSVDYTLSGSTITMNSAPLLGSQLYAFYSVTTSGTPAFITSTGNTASIDLGVTTGNLTASFNYGTLAATSPLSYNGTGTFSIPQATSSVDGYLGQTDFAAFLAKQNALTVGTSLQYLRGDLTNQTLDTSVVPENGNLYFTNARGIAASLTGYTAGAGVVSSADSVLSAMQKVDGNEIALSGSTLGKTLTSADIFMGNGSNQATGVAVSGDLTAINTGAFTVAKIDGTVVSGTTGTTNVVFSASPTLTGTALGANLTLSGTLTVPTIVSTAGSGTAITVTGGTAASNGAGGQATVAGAAGSGVTSGGAGGALNLNGGNAGGDNTANEAGGAVNITAGTSKGSATGGTVTINSSTGGIGTGTAGATGGTTNINGGTGGAGSATSGNGGGATLKGGSGGGGVAGGAGGVAQLTGGTGGTGSASGGNGGAANLQGGTAANFAGAQGGAISLSGGNGSGTGAGGAGGAITLSSGTAGGDNTTNNSGGSVTITANHSMGSAGGPAVQITAGTGGVGSGTAGANGGNANINAGTGGAGSASGGNGGNVVLTAGNGGTSTSNGSGGVIEFFTGATTSSTEHFRVSSASVFTTNADIQTQTAGFGLGIKSGSNAKIGTATLAAGTVTVSDSAVTANSRIFLTSQSDGGTPGFLRVTAKTAGTSFVITSSSGSDTSVVAYVIIESL